MDEGIAVAFAGLVGLFGAGIGGLATAYGARVGAEKMIEAAQAQVQDQSSAEHAHWLRDQQRLVCSEIADQFAGFLITAVDYTLRLERDSSVPEEVCTALEGNLRSLLSTVTRSQLWGPDEVVVAAIKLGTATTDASTAFKAWHKAHQGADQVAVDTRREESVAAAEAASIARDRFLAVARATLATSPS